MERRIICGPNLHLYLTIRRPARPAGSALRQRFCLAVQISRKKSWSVRPAPGSRSGRRLVHFENAITQPERRNPPLRLYFRTNGSSASTAVRRSPGLRRTM